MLKIGSTGETTVTFDDQVKVYHECLNATDEDDLWWYSNQHVVYEVGDDPRSRSIRADRERKEIRRSWRWCIGIRCPQCRAAPSELCFDPRQRYGEHLRFPHVKRLQAVPWRVDFHYPERDVEHIDVRTGEKRIRRTTRIEGIHVPLDKAHGVRMALKVAEGGGYAELLRIGGYALNDRTVIRTFGVRPSCFDTMASV